MSGLHSKDWIGCLSIDGRFKVIELLEGDKSRLKRILQKNRLLLRVKDSWHNSGPLIAKVFTQSVETWNNPDVQLLHIGWSEEVGFMESVTHSNLMPLVSRGRFNFEANNYEFFVMPECIPLPRFLQRYPLSELCIEKLAIELLRTLADIHRNGYIHRDLSPHNIFLRELPAHENRNLSNGNCGSSKRLTDFRVLIGDFDTLVIATAPLKNAVGSKLWTSQVNDGLYNRTAEDDIYVCMLLLWRLCIEPHLSSDRLANTPKNIESVHRPTIHDHEDKQKTLQLSEGLNALFLVEPGKKDLWIEIFEGILGGKYQNPHQKTAGYLLQKLIARKNGNIDLLSDHHKIFDGNLASIRQYTNSLQKQAESMLRAWTEFIEEHRDAVQAIDGNSKLISSMGKMDYENHCMKIEVSNLKDRIKCDTDLITSLRFQLQQESVLLLNERVFHNQVKLSLSKEQSDHLETKNAVIEQQRVTDQMISEINKLQISLDIMGVKLRKSQKRLNIAYCVIIGFLLFLLCIYWILRR